MPFCSKPRRKGSWKAHIDVILWELGPKIISQQHSQGLTGSHILTESGVFALERLSAPFRGIIGAMATRASNYNRLCQMTKDQTHHWVTGSLGHEEMISCWTHSVADLKKLLLPSGTGCSIWTMLADRVAWVFWSGSIMFHPIRSRRKSPIGITRLRHIHSFCSSRARQEPMFFRRHKSRAAIIDVLFPLVGWPKK